MASPLWDLLYKNDRRYANIHYRIQSTINSHKREYQIQDMIYCPYSSRKSAGFSPSLTVIHIRRLGSRRGRPFGRLSQMLVDKCQSLKDYQVPRNKRQHNKLLPILVEEVPYVLPRPDQQSHMIRITERETMGSTVAT